MYKIWYNKEYDEQELHVVIVLCSHLVFVDGIVRVTCKVMHELTYIVSA
jgi:hypothetical protein